MDQKTKNKLKRKIRQFKKINFVRRIVQLVCFLLLPGFFIQIYSSTKALVVALLAGSFSLQANSIDLVVVLSVYPLTLLFGRFFCGWICAMGSLGDLLTSIRNGLKIKEHQIGESADSKLKLVKYMLLLFSIIFIWVLQIVAIPQGLNPLDAFGVLVSLENLDMLFTTFLIATILLIGIWIASFFVPRFFCRYLCPTGAETSTGQYQDGTYEGSARGFKGLITVSVTVENGLITDIEDVSNNDTPSFFERCWSVVTGDIIGAQSTDVDAVTGATYSSVGIMDAVADALSGQTATASTVSDSTEIETDTSEEAAASSSEESASSSITAGQYADGIYTGSGIGFRGETVVEVTVQNGLITDITETSKQDDDQFFYRAWSTVIEEIITAQAVEVDAVSGATFSSNSIMEAVSDALGLAFENPNSSLPSGH
ncbi:FMN-binding protein [Trichococcus shcherbakoviae]|uniref:FMN-binding protein n=1 Tax=Trichococcus shcherbakoviae subsp. psychrophilus TaxID=2585775 RepID=A0A5C5E4K5_9LACT|nr:FMN-binding protein [Trichococcus shcherbakoviae]TNV67849.1 FMN-binding protein [Trichococcus shcherbakoviae subsp. psychrophilus]